MEITVLSKRDEIIKCTENRNLHHLSNTSVWLLSFSYGDPCSNVNTRWKFEVWAKIIVYYFLILSSVSNKCLLKGDKRTVRLKIIPKATKCIRNFCNELI